MMVEVPMEPPTFEVMTLPDEERVFVVLRLVTERLVVVAEVEVRAPMNPLVKVSPVPDTPVVDALVAVNAEMNPLVKVSPVPEIPVVEAFPRYA
jgi:hypothetical protein